MWDNSKHTRNKRDKTNGQFLCLLIAFSHEKTFRDLGSGFVVECFEFK